MLIRYLLPPEKKETFFSANLLGSFWGGLMKKRREAYGKGTLKSHDPGIPVISVGNLSLGGNAKTPLCVLLANILLGEGKVPAILSRGYRRKKTMDYPDPVLVSAGEGPLVPWKFAGDEPWLMARETRAMVLVSAKRKKAALEAERLGADVLVLDDGFQHLALARDINILCLPSDKSPGDNRVFPAGTLREPPSALDDADLFVALGTRLHPDVERIAGTRPVFLAKKTPKALWDPKTRKDVPPEALKNTRFCAFCGIADPDSFRDHLESLSLEPVAFKAYPDHTPYDGTERDFLKTLPRFARSEFLVTTSKDAVKLADAGLPLLVLKTELEPSDPAAFRREILDRLEKARARKAAKAKVPPPGDA
ncbi:MAG: tetraacyldisaccharide 4'-kinase [Deltaproteobacteria bacterium]|jgi:tetraacyldisaccharide 4'-kinase|nr:tetraacyldisaccharide 4'-kinase [Deltaproteobacteria bacterium]